MQKPASIESVDGTLNMKPLDSAKVTFNELPGGRLEIRIDHDLIKNCTTKMMYWWWHNMDSVTTWNGHDFSGPEILIYRLWHARDHIQITQVQPGKNPEEGGCAEGGVVNIKERILLKHPLDAKAKVFRSDESEMDFYLVAGPLKLGRLDHLFHQESDHVKFTTIMFLGVKWPLIGRVMNRLIRKFMFTEVMLKDWVLHNVEETGETEKFVPTLYNNQDKVYKLAKIQNRRVTKYD